jgi:plastocyanin
MPARPRDARAVLVGLMVVAGCSSHQSATTTPSVTFGSTATTPGMPGMSGMAPMPNMPAGTTAATAGPAAPVSGNAVSIDNFAFAPATLTVPAGSTVTWTNKDEEPHTVVANDGSFHSPGMGSQATFSYTFAKAGKFDYVCSIHPYMHATVVVTQ